MDRTKKYIIFDFDGTVANTFDYAVDFLVRESGQPPLNRDQRAAMHGLSMAGIARRLGIPWHRLPGLFFKGRHEMSPAMKNVSPFDGIADVIKGLHDDGHKLFILSTNTTRNINKFLRHNGMEGYFAEIYGGVGMFGKAPALRRLLLEQHIEHGRAAYVGDELRDMMAAKSLGVHTIAVTWGFARSADLKAEGVDGLARHTGDIARIIDKL